MKFLTSADIRIASEMRFACLDIRMKKVPSLLEIFDAQDPVLTLQQSQKKEMLLSSVQQSSNATKKTAFQQASAAFQVPPVFELELKPGQNLSEETFSDMNGY